jgi:hypothetical protein
LYELKIYFSGGDGASYSRWWDNLQW